MRQLARLNEARRDHLQAHGREPSTAKGAAAATGYSPEQVGSLIASARPARGLEEVVSGADGTLGTLEDLVPDPGAEGEYEEVVERMQIEQLPSLSETLDEREREIVYSHYGLGRPAETLQEIGGRLGLSTSDGSSKSGRSGSCAPL